MRVVLISLVILGILGYTSIDLVYSNPDNHVPGTSRPGSFTQVLCNNHTPHVTQ